MLFLGCVKAVVLTSFSRDRFHLYVARSGTKLEKTSLSADGNMCPFQRMREPQLNLKFYDSIYSCVFIYRQVRGLSYWLGCQKW